jgi:hypothetical protein
MPLTADLATLIFQAKDGFLVIARHRKFGSVILLGHFDRYGRHHLMLLHCFPLKNFGKETFELRRHNQRLHVISV